MKILITGITGLLGKQLALTLSTNHEIIGLSRTGGFMEFPVHHVDLTDQIKSYQLITKINPDIVIHTAAMSNVDECERRPDDAFRNNAIASKNVALACQRFDTEMLHISTDYVFSSSDTTRRNGFIETDVQIPLGVYSRSKADAEKFVSSLLNKFYIVRVSWLFGSWRDNFALQTIRQLNEGKSPTMVDDMVSAPTYVNDLAAAIGLLIKSHAYGTFHITNDGFASRYEIACEIANALGLPTSLIKRVSLADLKLAAPRPTFSGLDNFYWRISGFSPMRPWKDAIREFVSGHHT